MKELEAYELARQQISDELGIQCCCGRLLTGLHETYCRRFIARVRTRQRKILRSENNACAEQQRK